MKKKEFGIILTLMMVLLVAIAIPFAIGCGGGGDDEPVGIGATGDILYEGSTASEAVVAAWVAELVEGGSQVMAAADTTEVITHSMGNTPSGVSVMVDGVAAATPTYAVGTASLTSTQFTVTRSGTDVADRQLIWIAVK